MFKWLKSKKQARIEQLERQLAGRDERIKLMGTTRICLEQGVKFYRAASDRNQTLADNLAHANKYQRDMIGKGLGQVGINWTAEKIYLAKLLREYYDPSYACVIFNDIYATTHFTPDAMLKAIKRWDKKGVTNGNTNCQSKK